MRGSWLSFMGAYFLVLISMFSIGLLVGGVASNIKTASVLASVLYFPMLIFSGATVPYEVMPTSLQKVADFMPLTQGIKLLKSSASGMPLTTVWPPILIMVILGSVCTLFKWE